jgi:hypothetical protein
MAQDDVALKARRAGYGGLGLTNSPQSGFTGAHVLLLLLYLLQRDTMCLRVRPTVQWRLQRWAGEGIPLVDGLVGRVQVSQQHAVAPGKVGHQRHPHW